MQSVWTSPYHAAQSIMLMIALAILSAVLYGSLRSLWAEFRKVDKQMEMEKPTAAGEHGQSAS